MTGGCFTLELAHPGAIVDSSRPSLCVKRRHRRQFAVVRMEAVRDDENKVLRRGAGGPDRSRCRAKEEFETACGHTDGGERRHELPTRQFLSTKCLF